MVWFIRRPTYQNADQISWKTALDTIEVRSGLGHETENASLRCWRGVIEKAYANFQANLPGYGPTLLTSLALSVDGRTEGSSYPNLILATEREPYGL